MPEQTFNEAEQYLLKNWTTTMEVEESVDQIRVKYQVVCDGIAKTVKEGHSELDVDIVEVTRISGGPLKSGVIMLGRSSWPSAGKNYPSGFWIDNLRLDVLADQEEDPPTVGFWLCWSDDKEDVVYEPAENSITEVARKLLTSNEPSRWQFGDDEDTALIGRALASKQELLEMLAKGETDRFVETIVDQLEELTVLIPAIDEALQKIKQRSAK